MTNDLSRICFVTGTRAEFGLMHTTLEAIRAHRGLRLQIVATGMHLQRQFGRTVEAIRREGWHIDATVPWPAAANATPTTTAAAMGGATARLPGVFERLRSDVVLVVGDRVEAFAAAAAAHVCGRVVAHVHGGDRAAGQVDDALRHAITKLAHVHFPATRQSAQRVRRLGEDPWRIHRVGSPGIDGITQQAASRSELAAAFPAAAPGRFALIVIHPTDADPRTEQQRAETLLAAVRQAGVPHSVIVYPNNDPGSAGIVRCWLRNQDRDDVTLRRDVLRPLFLGLMREAAVIVGNSSSGIIEAASFGTPVIDVGPRQDGRERSANVRHVEWNALQLRDALSSLWKGGPKRGSRARNVYGGDGAGQQIADTLARLTLDARLRRKLIVY